jgi:hypothetical protein
MTTTQAEVDRTIAIVEEAKLAYEEWFKNHAGMEWSQRAMFYYGFYAARSKDYAPE